MVAVNAIRTEVVISYRSDGVERTKAQADQVAKSQENLAKATDAVGAAEERVARRRPTMAEALARSQRQQEAGIRLAEAAANSNEAIARSVDSLAQSQVRAANDNAVALERESSAFRSAGKWAAEHPTLVLAGSVLAARALSGFAASASTSLAAASARTAAYAAASTEMGAATAAGATAAARGLGLASTAAGAAAVGLGRYSETVSGLTTATGLLTRGLSALPGVLGPVGAVFLAFELGKAAISKAFDDLEKLVTLGKQAQQLDISAPFLKNFQGVGASLRLEVNQVEAAIERASSFVRDQFNQQNELSKRLSDINKTGVAGADGLAASKQLDAARDTEGRIKAGLAAMQELDALGLHLASLQIGESLFGPEVAARLRTGEISAAQIADKLAAAAQTEPLRQETADRAVALDRSIADAKQGISDALAVTLDFSAAALVAKDAWLGVLQSVQFVVEKINAANAASADLIGTLTTKALDGIKGVFGGTPSKPTVTAPAAPAEPEITARQFPYVFGPFKPDTPQLKQQQQAAQEAVSSYDMLIKRTEDRIKEVNLEADSVGKTRDEVIKLKLAHDLERAALASGVTVTDDMRKKWAELGTELAQGSNRLEDSRRALENTREAQRELANEFATFADDILLGGQKIGDAFKGLSHSFSSSTLKALLTGEGPLAGLFNTAPTERGGVGGILGGQFNLSKTLGLDNLKVDVGDGAYQGITDAFAPLLKTQKNADGKDMGFASTPLGQGLGSAMAGAGIGYSSGSPLMGALGGGMAGLMTGNPVMAAIGVAGGLVGGAYGQKPASKKDRDREHRNRIREFRARCDADGREPVFG